MTKLTTIESNKSILQILELIKTKSKNYNFIIRTIFDMKQEFQNHNVTINKDFDFFSIMICNPEKAYDSISKSPIRGTILLPPKQIIVYKDKNINKTIISYMSLEKEDLIKMLPEDVKFQESLTNSCNKIIQLIKSII